MNTLLVIGADAAASWMGYRVRAEKLVGVGVYVDASTSLRRVWRLLVRRRLQLTTLLKLAVAEKFRETKPFECDGAIHSNSDLLAAIDLHRPERVLCFRCGLVINRDVIATGIPILNLHVSSLPEFAGLGTIAHAINVQAWDQFACIHRVEETIDSGEVLMKKAYRLHPGDSYKSNEDRAYRTGVELAIDFLQQGVTPDV